MERAQHRGHNVSRRGGVGVWRDDEDVAQQDLCWILDDMHAIASAVVASVLEAEQDAGVAEVRARVVEAVEVGVCLRRACVAQRRARFSSGVDACS